MIKALKNATIGAILYMGFAPFFSLADGQYMVDWINPEQDQEKYYLLSNDQTKYNDADQACRASPHYVSSYYGTPTYLTIEELGTSYTCLLYESEYNSKIAHYGGTKVEENVVSCKNGDYPLPEEHNGNGEFDMGDHCHATTCNRNGENGVDMMLNNEGRTGFGCGLANNGTGEYCEYVAQTVIDADTGQSLNNWVPTGESCGTGGGFDEALLIDSELNQMPDPSDPNSPPTPDGNDQCTSIQNGFDICIADRDEMCDEQGVCADGCGSVNGQFVCIVDSNGENVDPNITKEEEVNDNSDNQQPDDPNTAGDEGSHSRLDGLLENTDGIEGLLKQIKDGINKGNAEQAKEEKACPANSYRIGKKCVSFPNKLAPAQNGLDTTNLENEIVNLKIELKSLYNSISGSISSMVGISEPTAVYSSSSIDVKGVTIDTALTRWLTQINIGMIVIFIFSVKAFFIILGAKS